MVKLKKADLEGIDFAALDAEEVGEGFTNYKGDVPPVGTILGGFVKRAWWTRTKEYEDTKTGEMRGDDPMVVLLFEAAENDGDLEEFNGCPIWERLVFTGPAKFRWDKFLTNFGLPGINSLKKIEVTGEEETLGAPIESWAGWVPNSEDSWCRVVTDRHRWDGKWQTDVGEWLPYFDDEEGEPAEDLADDEEDQEEYDEEDGEEYEEGDEEGDAEEPEEPEEPRRRGPARAAPARSRRPAAEPAAEPGRKPARSAARTNAAAPERAARTSSRPAAARPAAARTGSRSGTAAAAAPARGAAGRPTRRGQGSGQKPPPF